MVALSSSKLAKVLSTNKVIEQLDRDGLACLSDELIQQLGCDSKAQFMTKILALIYSNLSHSSLESLKSTAIGLLQTQKNRNPTPPAMACGSVDNNNPNCTTTTTTTTSPNEAHTEIESLLETLPSNNIDYLGSFLTLKERLRFGTVNRHFYIETQKRSFLLQSANEDLVVINDKTNDQTLFKFCLSAPKKLYLRHLSDATLQKLNIDSLVSSAWFASLFGRVSELRVHPQWMPYIPMDALLHGSKDYIPMLVVNATPMNNTDTCLHQFATNYQMHLKPAKQSNQHLDTDKMTTGSNSVAIEQLAFFTGYASDEQKLDIKPVLMALDGNYMHLRVEDNICIKIGNFQELKTIFHGKLESLMIGSKSNVSTNCIDDIMKMNIDTNNTSESFKSWKWMGLVWNRLATLECHDICTNFCELISSLDCLGLRTDMKMCVVQEKYPSFSRTYGEQSRIKKKMLNALIFGHAVQTNQTNQVNKVEFEILQIHIRGLQNRMATTQWYFEYLMESRSKLLHSKKHRQLKYIRIMFDVTLVKDVILMKDIDNPDGLFGDYMSQQDLDTARNALQNPGNKKVCQITPGKRKAIRMKNCDLSRSSFIIIFACLLRMFELARRDFAVAGSRHCNLELTLNL